MKHGMHKTPTYNSWISMKRRCGLLKGNPHPNYTGEDAKLARDLFITGYLKK